jgi:Glycosyl transferase family 2
MDAMVPLSIVVATTEGWPYTRPVLESIRQQAEEAGAEIVIADGSGRLPPAQDEVGARTRWLSLAEDSVFRLFAVGLSQARGEIVATTEDHCTVRPGWCAAILGAHREHPAAAAIGGAIENGSTGSLLDWASYFITQGPHMAPLGRREVSTTTNEADLSFKRWALPAGVPDGPGFMAVLYTRQLADGGAELRVDDRMVVDHFQSIGVAETSAIHFHNGRSISGFRRLRGMATADWLRLSVGLLLPAWRTGRAFRSGWAKGRLRTTLAASLPWALWLEYCQGVGNVIGYALGPGSSPRHLR